MRATIDFSGYPSVGIPPSHYVIEGLPEPDNEEDRLYIRQQLCECFTNIEGEKCGVWFSDECYECGGVGKCLPDCPNKTQDGYEHNDPK